MLKTMTGGDGKPYISLEDFMDEVKDSILELEDKLISSDDNSENIEDRIDFLEKLYESLTSTQSDYYKKILGM